MTNFEKGFIDGLIKCAYIDVGLELPTIKDVDLEGIRRGASGIYEIATAPAIRSLGLRGVGRLLVTAPQTAIPIIGAGVGAAYGGYQVGKAMRHLPVYDSNGNRTTLGEKLDDADWDLGGKLGRWWYGDENTGKRGFGSYMPWNKNKPGYVHENRNTAQSTPTVHQSGPVTVQSKPSVQEQNTKVVDNTPREF